LPQSTWCEIPISCGICISQHMTAIKVAQCACWPGVFFVAIPIRRKVQIKLLSDVRQGPQIVDMHRWMIDHVRVRATSFLPRLLNVVVREKLCSGEDNHHRPRLTILLGYAPPFGKLSDTALFAVR
jgi:hypothetical protein